MNIRGLQEWIFTNSEEDQWWICTDNITKETPVTIDEIEKVALSGDFKKIQVLHTSQSNMSNPPWILLEVVEKSPSSPIRMNNSLVSNRNLPPPPLPHQSQGVEKEQNSYGKVDELLGIISLTIPLISCLAIWFWVGSMALIQNPGSSLQMIIVLTVASTSILNGVDASKIGVGSDVDKRGKKKTGPAGWVVFSLLLWLVAFPSYMWYRSRYGAKNMVIPALAITLIFIVSAVLMSSAIDESINEIQRTFQNY